MSRAIEEMVGQCVECRVNSNKSNEPLRPTATPDRPWQMLGTDLFHFKGQTYLIVIDYYSRYPELALLGSSDFSSKKVIMSMKSMFARHGLPELIISDNGPQYASREFAEFAEEYGFRHVTSSPHYPRANGAAERAVQTIKNMLKKENDPYLALLAYRASPQFGLYSPAELLMARKLRTTVVTHPDDLEPRLPDHARFKAANEQYKSRMKANHDSNSRVKDLPGLRKGDSVWLRGSRQMGTVKADSNLMSRCVPVNAEHGEMIRNRSDLVPVQRPPSSRSIQMPSKLDIYDCSR